MVNLLSSDPLNIGIKYRVGKMLVPPKCFVGFSQVFSCILKDTDPDPGGLEIIDP
jgi:hypothetical protein